MPGSTRVLAPEVEFMTASLPFPDLGKKPSVGTNENEAAKARGLNIAGSITNLKLNICRGFKANSRRRIGFGQKEKIVSDQKESYASSPKTLQNTQLKKCNPTTLEWLLREPYPNKQSTQLQDQYLIPQRPNRHFKPPQNLQRTRGNRLYPGLETPASMDEKHTRRHCSISIVEFAEIDNDEYRICSRRSAAPE